jgi:hypothetical protein
VPRQRWRRQNRNGRHTRLKLADFTDPSSLKDRTDGEFFYIIKNGTRECPPQARASSLKKTGTW